MFNINSLLILVILISSCSIKKHERYFASKTELTLTQSGVPIKGISVKRKISHQGNDKSTIDQVCTTDGYGIATFLEYSETEFINTIGTSVYTHRYYLQSKQERQLIKRIGKVGYNRYSDSSSFGSVFDFQDKSIKLFIDLDSLNITKYDYPPTDPRSHTYQRLNSK